MLCALHEVSTEHGCHHFTACGKDQLVSRYQLSLYQEVHIREKRFVEEQLLAGSNFAVIQPCSNSRIEEFFFVLCILADQLKLRKIEEPCCRDCLIQMFTALVSFNEASIQELQTANKRLLTDLAGVQDNVKDGTCFCCLPEMAAGYL